MLGCVLVVALFIGIRKERILMNEINGFMIRYVESKELVHWSAMYSIVFETEWEAENERKSHHDKDKMESFKVIIKEGSDG